MQRSDLVRAVADELSLPETTVRVVIVALFKAMTRSLVRNEPISIRGFGKFRPVLIPASQRPNPSTGVLTRYGATRSTRWKSSKSLRDELNNKCLEERDSVDA